MGGPVTLTAENPEQSWVFKFPEGAEQGGKPWWYGVRLHYRLTLARDTGSGFIDFDSSTRSWASALIEYTVDRTEDHFRVKRTAVGVHHNKYRQGAFKTDELRFWNIMPIKGVRPGRSRWRIRVQQFKDARIERVVVYPDSELFRTKTNPYPLKISAKIIDGPPAVGQRFHVEVTLSAPAKRPVRHVSLNVLTVGESPPRLDEGPKHRDVGTVRNPRIFRYTFTPTATGHNEIGFFTESDLNRPSTVISYDIDDSSAGVPLWPPWAR